MSEVSALRLGWMVSSEHRAAVSAGTGTGLMWRRGRVAVAAMGNPITRGMIFLATFRRSSCRLALRI